MRWALGIWGLTDGAIHLVGVTDKDGSHGKQDGTEDNSDHVDYLTCYLLQVSLKGYSRGGTE